GGERAGAGKIQTGKSAEAFRTGFKERRPAGDLRRLDHRAKDVFAHYGGLPDDVRAGVGGFGAAIWLGRRARTRVSGADDERLPAIPADHRHDVLWDERSRVSRLRGTHRRDLSHEFDGDCGGVQSAWRAGDSRLARMRGVEGAVVKGRIGRDESESLQFAKHRN